MLGKRYDPLPQFSDSESDIDIFNSKGQYQATSKQEQPKRGYSGRKYFAYIIIFIVSVVIIAACFALVHYKRNTYHNKLNVVQTSIGYIKGIEEISNGKKVHKFMGVPYAEPPVGERRWKNPVAKMKLPNVYLANANDKICFQYAGSPYSSSKQESEDCLYLNIFTPTLNKTANLPVFVWIHGGYLVNGYGDMPGYHPDSEFVTDMNVVGVSIQYRLNAFGYLTLKELWGKDKSYGNFGLSDQILALKWVKENIKQFGGNSNLITVAGQSSGGTSIFALVASPSASGLFQRGIPMSGSPNFPRNYSSAANENQLFIEKSKCNVFSTEQEIRNCFYGLSSKEIIEIIPEVPIWNFNDLLDFPAFGRVDGSMLVIDPLTMTVAPKDAYLVKNLTSKVDLLIGSTAQEPSIGPAQHFKSKANLTHFLDKKLTDFKSVSSKDVFQVYENASVYVNGTIDTQFLYESIVTDVRCSCPTNELVKNFRKSSHLSSTYRYVSAWKPEKPINMSFSVIVNAAHALDSFALFGFKILKNIKLTPTEKMFVKSIRKIFKKFMVEGKVDGAKPGETIVFNSDGNVENIKGDYHQAQCQLWSKLSNGFLPYAWIN